MAAAKIARLRRAQVVAAIYVCQRTGWPPAAEQEAACRAITDAHGWTVAEVLVDNEIGARRPGRRDEYERMLELFRAGALQAAAVYHVDLLTPKRADLEPFMSLADANDVKLATATGEIDLSTKGGRQVAKQMGAMARHDRDTRTEEAQKRNAKAARRGDPWRSGSRCYGYSLDGTTIVEDEAEVLRDVADRIIRGESLRQVCQTLNDAGVVTTLGKQWHPTSLRRLISNPRLAGKRLHKGKVTSGNWPPILTEQGQRQVEAKLDERTTVHHKKPDAGHPRRYLLTGGLLICGLCGSPLMSQPSRGNKRGYVCRKGPDLPGCGKIRIIADPIETEVAERVLARIASPSIRRRLAAKLQTDGEFGGDRLLERISDEEGRLTELAIDYADRKIGRVEFHAARDRIQQRIDDLRSAANGAARMRTLPGLDADSLAEWWVNASLTERRDLVSLVLDHVEVGKATRFGPVGLDSDRLSWMWRVG